MCLYSFSSKITTGENFALTKKFFFWTKFVKNKNCSKLQQSAWSNLWHSDTKLHCSKLCKCAIMCTRKRHQIRFLKGAVLMKIYRFNFQVFGKSYDFFYVVVVYASMHTHAYIHSPCTSLCSLLYKLKVQFHGDSNAVHTHVTMH